VPSQQLQGQLQTPHSVHTRNCITDKHSIKSKTNYRTVLEEKHINTEEQTKKLRGFSPQANYTDRASDRSLSAKLVPNLADRGCRVVSATDPHSRNLGFLDPGPLLLHSSSSSIILTRLSGPRSRPTTSQKIW
jgi:hypothetical protein